MAKLNDATDVVALLTPSSIDRPWILYEAGVAKGKLNTTVFGIALGIPLPKASVGPFAQFQNCADDQESLTKLVLQLIRRNPDANPREEAVARQVAAFLEAVQTMFKKRSGKSGATTQEMDATTVAKLFEEVKVMFRDLPQKVGDQLPVRRRRMRKFHPMIMEELFEIGRSEGVPIEGSWLLLAPLFRDDAPWLYELAMDVYRAICAKNKARIEEAWNRMQSTVRMAGHSRFMFELEERGDQDMFMMFRHFPEFFEQMMPNLMIETSSDSRPTGSASEKRKVRATRDRRQ